MGIKFRTQAAHLHDVLGVVGIVSPSPVTPQGGAGFLFTVKDGKCQVHSRDQLHASRADLEVVDVEGEGSFTYPASQIGALQCLDGWIEFEAENEGNEYTVKYETEGGASSKKSAYDPRFMQPCDLKDATDEREYPVVLLKEALTSAKPYLAKSNDSRVDDHFKALQIFDESREEWKKGDGYLFAATGIRAFYFHSDAFRGKGLSLHGQHLPQLLNFLARSTGDVKVLVAPNMTYAVNAAGAVFGWARHDSEHGKFSYYPRKADKFILRVPVGLLLKTLRYARAELDSKLDKIRVEYTCADNSLRFKTSDGGANVAHSVPVGVAPVEDEDGSGAEGKTGDFAVNANVDHFLDLVTQLKVNEVNLRVAVMEPKGKKKIATFRTIEEFWLDDKGQVLTGQDEEKRAHLCQVTRFMPSKD